MRSSVIQEFDIYLLLFIYEFHYIERRINSHDHTPSGAASLSLFFLTINCIFSGHFAACLDGLTPVLRLELFLQALVLLLLQLHLSSVFFLSNLLLSLQLSLFESISSFDAHQDWSDSRQKFCQDIS